MKANRLSYSKTTTSDEKGMYHIIRTDFDTTKKLTEYDIPAKVSFMVSDVLGLIAEQELFESGAVTQIISAYHPDVEARKVALKEAMDKHIEKDIVLSHAYISSAEFPQDEYYLEGDPSTYGEGKKPIPADEVLKRELDMLVDMGFVSINDFVGYEYSIACLYVGNNVGQKLYEEIKKEIEKNGK